MAVGADRKRQDGSIVRAWFASIRIDMLDLMEFKATVCLVFHHHGLNIILAASFKTRILILRRAAFSIFIKRDDSTENFVSHHKHQPTYHASVIQ